MDIVNDLPWEITRAGWLACSGHLASRALRLLMGLKREPQMGPIAINSQEGERIYIGADHRVDMRTHTNIMYIRTHAHVSRMYIRTHTKRLCII